ncbi:MAG: peptidoglycan-binding protein [Alphaproteobacteria bacterium]|jgi:TPR repeat protein
MEPDSDRSAGSPGAPSGIALARLAGAFAAGALAGGLAVFLLASPPPPALPVAPAVTQPAQPPRDDALAAGAQRGPAPGAAPAQPSPPSTQPPPPAWPADPLQALREAAERGDATAQFELGARHAAGDGVDQDWAAALAWFRRAAEAGGAAAQHNLAVLHERGRGTEPDPVEAVRWYEMAALQGYRPSQFNLAVAHARGAGTPRDMGKAVAWFERAAEQVPQANYALGEIFEDGAGGIGKDLERARSHYLLAELGGDARATARLAELTPEAVERGTLREIQEQLARLRIEPGGTDGRMGQRTAAAIRRFQKSAGLPEDGKPGQALLERLRATPAPR